MGKRLVVALVICVGAIVFGMLLSLMLYVDQVECQPPAPEPTPMSTGAYAKWLDEAKWLCENRDYAPACRAARNG